MPKKKGGSRRKVYSAPALEKGLDILELLAGEADGLNTTQISERLGKPLGQLFRMLVVLQQRGYVAHIPGSERYGLTLKVFNLAHQLPAIMRLTSIATPIMKSLSRDTYQSCHLVIQYSGRGHVVVQQDAPSARVLSVRLGAEAPLMDTCSGHVLLAFSSPEDRAAMIDEIPKGHRRPSKAALKKIVDRISADGYESIASAQIQGVQDVGFPVIDHSGNVAAVLVTPFVAYLDGSNPMTFEDARSATGAAASAMSEALGYRDDL